MIKNPEKIGDTKDALLGFVAVGVPAVAHFLNADGVAKWASIGISVISGLALCERLLYAEKNLSPKDNIEEIN